MPRRAVDLNLEQLEQLAAMACTQEEVAAFFGVTQQTISRKLAQRKYSEVWERGLGRGRISLRRRQLKKDTTAMLIWLGKQHLGQREAPHNDATAMATVDDWLKKLKGEA